MARKIFVHDGLVGFEWKLFSDDMQSVWQWAEIAILRDGAGFVIIFIAVMLYAAL